MLFQSFGWCISICWLVFLVVWIISAVRAKRKAVGASRWKGAWVRVLLAIGLVELPRLEFFRELSDRLGLWVAPVYGLVGGTGVVLCAAGVGFAIWARVHIGRNWGMPMSLQEGHALVTSGPYAWVRHPIYTGMLLGMLGTALALGPIWLVILLILGGFFVYSARIEEGLMVREFPKEYPAYRQRTKMLVPFLW